jgi:hypothetical protein
MVTYLLGTPWAVWFPVDPDELLDYHYQVVLTGPDGFRAGPFREGLELTRYDDALELNLRADQTRVAPGPYTLVLLQTPDEGTPIETPYPIRVNRLS